MIRLPEFGDAIDTVMVMLTLALNDDESAAFDALDGFDVEDYNRVIAVFLGLLLGQVELLGDVKGISPHEALARFGAAAAMTKERGFPYS